MGTALSISTAVNSADLADADGTQYPKISGNIGFNAAELADGDIKFNELPEFFLKAEFSRQVSASFGVNLYSPAGDTVLTSQDADNVSVDTAFLTVKPIESVQIHLGRFENLMPTDYNLPWLYGPMAGVPPQIADESAFANDSIGFFTGVMVDHTIDVGGNKTLFMSAAIGNTKASDNTQGQLYASYTIPRQDGGKYVLGTEYLSRNNSGTPHNENLTTIFGALDRDLDSYVSVHADAQITHMDNLGGAKGKDGVFAQIRGAVVSTEGPSSLYIMGGVVREPTGETYPLVETGVTEQLDGGLQFNAGVGYASSGPYKGVSNSIGLRYSF